jgi:hypothetical protein
VALISSQYPPNRSSVLDERTTSAKAVERERSASNATENFIVPPFIFGSYRTYKVEGIGSVKKRGPL